MKSVASTETAKKTEGGDLKVGDLILLGSNKDRITKLTPYPMPSKIFEPDEASIAEFELSGPMTIEHNLLYEVP